MGFSITSMDDISDFYHQLISVVELPDNFVAQIVVSKEDFDSIVSGIHCSQFGYQSPIDDDCIIKKWAMTIRLTVKR
jgi:hypothetical protein